MNTQPHIDTFVVPEPDVYEEIGTSGYDTIVAYPHRLWTIRPLTSGYYAGEFYVTSDDGLDLGEMFSRETAVARIRDREES